MYTCNATIDAVFEVGGVEGLNEVERGHLDNHDGQRHLCGEKTMEPAQKKKLEMRSKALGSGGGWGEEEVWARCCWWYSLCFLWVEIVPRMP